MKGLLLLFKFMTRLPVPGGAGFDSKELGKGMKWFPIVGIVLGAINLLIAILLQDILSPVLLAIVLVTFDVIVTGGLHLDGLADTFDGIFSYRSKQKMLEIMKDSRVGTNGVLVLILFFIFKIAFLVETSELYGVSQGIIMFIVPVLSRVNSVANCTFEPYARATGMGKTFVDSTDQISFAISYIVTTAFLYVVSYYCLISFIHLFLILNIVVVCGILFGKLMTRKIGGITGDTLGALLELTSVLSLILMYFFL